MFVDVDCMLGLEVVPCRGSCVHWGWLGGAGDRSAPAPSGSRRAQSSAHCCEDGCRGSTESRPVRAGRRNDINLWRQLFFWIYKLFIYLYWFGVYTKMIVQMYMKHEFMNACTIICSYYTVLIGKCRKWGGSVMRWEDNVGKRVMGIEVQGRRKRGRPKRKWLDSVNGDLRGRKDCWERRRKIKWYGGDSHRTLRWRKRR